MSGVISSPPLFGASPSATLQQMWNTIRVRAAGVTDEQMQIEFLQAARDFFSESLAWQNDQSLAIAAPTTTVSTAGWLAGGTVITGAEVVAPLDVRFNDISLAPVAAVSDTAAAEVNTPQVYTFNLSGLITLVPQPNSAGGTLHIFVGLRPTIVTPVIPDVQLSQWFDGLLDGTLTRLYEQPGKPFSNAALAMVHAKRFRARISKARDIANRGFGRGGAPWSFPYFANGSGANLWGWGKGVRSG